MKVAIIVLNYNDFENTSNYIKIVEKYNIINKIIIVDNNSTIKGEFEKLSSLKNEKVDLVASDKNGGYAYGNNIGLKYLDKTYGNYDYVIISNPDVSIEENVIEQTIEFMKKNKNTLIATPRMYFKNGPARRSAWKYRKYSIDIASSTRIMQIMLFFLFKSGEYSRNEFRKDVLKVDGVAGAFFIADHNKFKNIGYFDEKTFLFFEEDIISYKAKEKGYDIYSLNNIKFIHYDSQCIGKIFNTVKKQDIMFNSRIYFHKKYNNAGKIKVLFLRFLRYARKFELIFEVPIRKLMKK